ncbi:galectin-4-like [Bufo gargarizans]|uniref:galectin-4-like n=1 Tax=Bufo gargarizans TaxID=30331 RepID=UPI001CF0D5FB|nr:galectin-4-like [Bufo gargarizans]XP_044162614.1 galectin-4-like [Bufo gargarizans]
MAFVPAPGYQPAYNPPIPFTSIIAGGLRPGMIVCVQATLPSKYNRFVVNLSAGQDEHSDKGFHMSARYDGRDRVVFNSKQGDVWGEEEMKRDMPFKSGKVFFIMIEVTHNNYQVFANGESFYEFGHKIPLERVNWLQVSGDITVQELSIVGSGPGVKGSLVLSAAQSNLVPMMGPPIANPAVPFSTFIRGGMIPKRTVVVKAMVKSKAKSFFINLKSGFNNDIALHLNPRLNKKTVVRNSFVNGAWGQEELELVKNPFKEGEFIDISIRSGEKQFKVFVNGWHCFDYAHRMGNLQQVDKLEVEGDVKIIYIYI